MSEKKAGKFAAVANKLSQLREAAPAAPVQVQTPPLPSTDEPKKLGRPRGKKTSPEYVQVTVYLRKNVHTAARKALLDDRRQFSDLVDELVSRWLSEFQKSER